MLGFKTVLTLGLFGLTLAQTSNKKSVTTSTFGGQKRTHAAGELIFEDNFDTLDHELWQHEITMAGGGNWEFEVYWNNRSNSYAKDGNLVIKPTLTADRFGEDFIRTGTLDLWGGAPNDYCTQNAFYGCSRAGGGTNLINPIASARLRTVNSFSFKYGKVEVRARNPTGDWLWPAIWMLPKNLEYGQWPTSGEIDIMESRGNLNYVDNNGVNIGAEQYGATLHYGVDYVLNGWPKAHFDKNTVPGAPWSNDFYRYQLEWTPDYIKWSVDDVEVGTVTFPEGGMWEQGNFANEFPGTANPWEGEHKSAPFNKEFYLILNNACGGTAYFTDEATNLPGGKPWSNTSPQAAYDFYMGKDLWYPTWNPTENNGEDAAMLIDYVRVWAL